MAEETTAKFSVDISDLKKGIQEANRQIKLANAEFKAASASMDKWSTSTEGLAAKITQTDKVLSAQKKILNSYKQEMEAVIEKYGENSKEADNAKIKYENQRAAVARSEKELEHYKESLAKLEEEQKEAAEAAKLQENAYNSLDREIKSQKSELDKLKSQYANVIIEQGKDSQSAKELATQIETLSSNINKNQKELKDADQAADEFDKSLKNTNGDVVEVSGGFSVLKGALADLVSAGIQKAAEALIDLGKAAYQAYEEYDAGADSIIAATGATGEAAEDLMRVYKNVSKDIVASYDEIGTAVGEVNTRFGATGDELTDLSEKFLKFSKLNGTDTKSSIDNVQAAMAAWGVSAKDASLLLDTLNKAGQDTGISVDNLSNSLVNNAPALQEMGFNVSDATMFLANLDKSGVDASSTMAGLKKALNNAAAEGKPMSEALSEMEDSIKNASSSTEAITTATELFGSKSAAAIAAAVRDGRLSFQELGTEMSDFEGNVNDTFENTLDGPDKLAQLIQDVKTEFATALDEFFTEYEPQITELTDSLINEIIPDLKDGLGWLINNLPLVVGAITTITAAVVAFKTAAAIGSIIDLWKKYELATKLAAAGQQLLNIVMAANPVGLIIAAIVGLIAAFVILWNKSEKFRNFWIGMWDGIQKAVAPAIEWITEKFHAFVEWIMENWQSIATFLINPFAGLFKYCYENFEAFRTLVDNTVAAVVGFFAGLWTSISSGASQAWTAITSVFAKIPEWFETKFKKAWENVKKVFSTGGKIFDGIKEGILNGLKSVINAIIRGINKVIAIPFKALNKALDKIRNFEILGSKPFSGLLGDITIPQIPTLARGGVLKRGQIGLLEGSGTEAVIPLENNRKWISATAKAMREALQVEGALGGIVSTPIVNNNYSFTQNNTSPKAIDALTVYRNTNSLLFAAQARLN